MKFSKILIPIFMALLMITPVISVNSQAMPLTNPNVANLVLYENVNGTGSHATYYNFTSNSMAINNNRSGLTSLVVNTHPANYTCRIDSAFIQPQTYIMELEVTWNNNGSIQHESIFNYTNVASSWGGSWRDISWYIPNWYNFNIHGNRLQIVLSVSIWLQFPVFLYSNRINITNGVVIPNPNPNPSPQQNALNMGFLIAGGLFLVAGIMSPAIFVSMYKKKSINGVTAFCGILIAIPMLFGLALYLLGAV